MKDFEFHPPKDLSLSRRARWASVDREPGLAEHLVHATTWRFLHAVLRAHQHLSVGGRDHLPEDPPYILVANHSSHFDALVLGAALPRRLLGEAYSLAAGDTFFADPVKSLCSAMLLNALPFWRRRCTAQSLEHLRDRMVHCPTCLIMFPEGTRSRTGEMQAFKSGIGLLVAGSPVPVVPCAIRGAHEAWPPGRKHPRRGRIEVRIGKPLRFEETPHTRAGWAQVAQDLEQAVRALGTEPDESPGREPTP